MNAKLTEIIFILDRSGSMQHMASDTIGGYNSFVENQKREDGEAKLTTVLFDDKYELLLQGVDIKTVDALTENEYYARGTTALLDAIGKTISAVGVRLAETEEQERPSRVVVAITTDGLENASREYSYQRIHEMITLQQDKYNWEFIFLGANMDAAKEAESLGIRASRSANFNTSKLGTDVMFSLLNENISKLRKGSNISENMNEDYNTYLKSGKKIEKS